MQLAAGDFWFTTAPPEWLRPPDSSVPPLRSQSVAAAASVPLAAVVCEGTVVVNGGCLWRGRREVGPVTFQEGPAVATNAAEVDRGWLPDGAGACDACGADFAAWRRHPNLSVVLYDRPLYEVHSAFLCKKCLGPVVRGQGRHLEALDGQVWAAYAPRTPARRDRLQELGAPYFGTKAAQKAKRKRCR